MVKIKNKIIVGVSFFIVLAFSLFVLAATGVFTNSYDLTGSNVLTNVQNESNNVHLTINDTSERELVLDGGEGKVYKPSILNSFEMFPSDPKGSLDDFYFVFGGVLYG